MRTLIVSMFVVAIFASLAHTAEVTGIFPRQGSVNGKTRLTILGHGFDERGRSNDVFIGTDLKGVFCDPIPTECTMEQIVCWTDAYPASGPMPVGVRSFGFHAACMIPGGCTFTYTLSSTPVVQRIFPEWFVAPAEIVVTGKSFTAGSEDFTTYIGAGERCSLVGSVTSTSFVCQAEPMIPGNLPVDVIMGESGRASLESIRTVTLLPAITAVYPNVGSIGGGHRVTVWGSSFSSVMSENVIKIHGAPCIVVAQCDEKIECITTPHDQTIAPEPVYEEGKALAEYWMNLPGYSIDVDFFGKKEYLFPWGSATTPTFGKATTDTVLPNCNECAFRFSTLFAAPATGNYVFQARGADTYEIWLSLDETPVERKLDNTVDPEVYNPRICSGRYPQTCTKTVALEAGKKYWMGGFLKESSGSEFLTMTITLPDGTVVTPSGAFLQYRDPWTPPIEMYVRGVKAVFGQDCHAWGACSYDYKYDSTPFITSVEGYDKAKFVEPYQRMTITGSNFDTSTQDGDDTECGHGKDECGGGNCKCHSEKKCKLNFDVCAWAPAHGKCEKQILNNSKCSFWSRNIVTVDGKPCLVMTQTSTQIICLLDYTTGGLHRVFVLVEPLGLAVGQVFVNVTGKIVAFDPPAGSVNGGNMLTVSGKAFDPYPGMSEVLVGDQNCQINSINTYWIECAVPKSLSGPGYTSLKVKVWNHFVQVLPYSYVYADPPRTGTDIVDETKTLDPKFGSINGNTKVRVLLPSYVSIGNLGQVTVKIGTVICDVLFAFGRELSFMTPPAANPGAFDVTVEYTSSAAVLTTISLGKFTYIASVTSVSRTTCSPLGGVYVNIDLDFHAPSPNEVSVAVEGQPCQWMRVAPSRITCLVGPAPATPIVLPVIDSFNFNGDGNDFTDRLWRLDYTPNVRVLADGTVFIPKGANYLMTRKSHTRPFVFRAKVRPLMGLSECGSNCAVKIRAGVDVNSWPSNGYMGIAGATTSGHFGFEIDGWRRLTSEYEYNGVFATVGLDSTKFSEYRMEVWHNWVRFFIDNVLIYEYEHHGHLSGSVGFGFSEQDIVVDDFVIESLYPRSLQVTIANVVLDTPADIVYTTRLLSTFVDVSTSQYLTRIIVQGTGFQGRNPFELLALKDADEAVTRYTPRLCTNGVATQNPSSGEWSMVCEKNSVAPGTYYVRLSSPYGVALDVYEGFQATPSVTAILPMKSDTQGRLLTIQGSNFDIRDPLSSVLVGEAFCPIVTVTPRQIVCSAPPAEEGMIQVKIKNEFAFDDGWSTCQFCLLEYNNENTGIAAVTSVAPTSGGVGQLITIFGTNFMSKANPVVYIGGVPCPIEGTPIDTEIMCIVPQTINSDNTVRIHFETGWASSTTTFTFVPVVDTISPVIGSPTGGQLVHLAGSGIPTIGGATVFVGVDFATAQGTDDGWSSSPFYFMNPNLHTCGMRKMLGGPGELDALVTISKTFSALPAHAAVRFAFKLIANFDKIRLLIDGQPFTFSSKYSLPVNECGDTSDSNHLFDSSIVLPHASSSIKIELTGDAAASGWWGFESYSLSTLATIQHVVTVGSSAASVVEVSDVHIAFLTPPGTGTGQAVEVTIAGDVCTGCNGKTYTYQETLEPKVTTVVLGLSSGRADESTPEFALSANMYSTYEGGILTLEKKGSNGWNTGAFAPRKMAKNDGTVVGVEFTVVQSCKVMIGLNEKHTSWSYQDISYALYLNGGSLRVYESGKYTFGFSYMVGDNLAVFYDSACGCIKYKRNARVFYVSLKKPIFPLYVDSSFYENCKVSGIKLLHTPSPKARLVLAGENIAVGAGTAYINGAPCDDFYVTSGHANCWTSEAITPGATVVNVAVGTIHGKGTAVDVPVTFGAALSPMISSSKNGGKVIEIGGGPFVQSPTVTAEGVGECIVTKFDEASVTCVLPALPATRRRQEDTTAALSVTIGAATIGASCLSTTAVGSGGTLLGCAQIEYTDANTPTIIDATPASPVSGTVLTITGTGFSSAPTVTFGTYTCAVLSATAIQIECTLPEIEAGSYMLQVQCSSGNSIPFGPVDVPLTVSGLSTTTTGNLGGALLVITGTGFGADSSTALTVQIGGADLCDSIARAGTTITCVTKAGDFSGPVVVTIGAHSATSTETFTAAASDTPEVTSITPDRGGRSVFVEIGGTNLGDGVVKIGTAACDVVFFTNKKIACIVEDGLPAGTQLVHVTTFARGKAISSVTFLVTMFVSHVAPSLGPAQGGQLITVYGSGFPVPNLVNVIVGGVPCDVQSATYYEIRCVTGPAPLPGTPGEHDVKLSLGDTSHFFLIYDAKNPHDYYEYDEDLTATITAISSAVGSAGGFEDITITGTGFGIDEELVKVFLGDTPCDVSEVQADGQYIVCRTRPGPATANAAVKVLIENKGYASNPNSLTFTTKLQIDAIEGGTEFSVEGGIVVTFVGEGFWPFESDDDWRKGYYTLLVGGYPCEVERATTTAVLCELSGTRREYINFPELVAAYPMLPSAVMDVALSINGIAATVPASIVINYKQSVTPIITSVTPTGIQTDGAEFVITGSKFAETGNTVQINGAPCAISAESATSITCTLTQGNVGKGFVEVIVPEIGKAFSQVTCPSGKYLLCDGSCISDTECIYDEWGMTKCAELTYLIVHDTFCHSNGGSDRVNKPLRTDAGRDFNINCPMYSCEGKDCDKSLYIGGLGGRVSTCGRDPNGFVVDYRPRITSVSPRASSLGGGLRITVSGTGFGSNKDYVSPYVGTALCSPISVTPTQVICETSPNPEASGLTFRLWVKGIEAVYSDPLNDFSYQAALTPTVTSISPTIISVSGIQVTITGSGFTGQGAEVTVDGTTAFVISVTDVEIIFVLPDLPPGVKPITLRIVGKGLPVGGLPTLENQLYISNVAPASGSLNGGTQVTIMGSGFTPKSVVTFGSCQSLFVSYASGMLIVETLQCDGQQTPVVHDAGIDSAACPSCTFNFHDYFTPKIVDFGYSAFHHEPLLTLTMSSMPYNVVQTDVKIMLGDTECTIASFSPTSIGIQFPVEHTAGTYEFLVKVTPRGYAKPVGEPPVFVHELFVLGISPDTGSLGGKQKVTVTGSGFGDVAYVAIGDSNCTVLTASYNKIVCETAERDSESSDPASVIVVHAKVKAPPGKQLTTNTFNYQNDKTPHVVTVTPTRGSTAGGTKLTITGLKLNKHQVVTIDGVVCAQSVSEQTRTDNAAGQALYCTTGPHPTMLAPAKIRVSTPSDGDAKCIGATYQYIDLWSRWTTWGGEPPPKYGDSAVIQEGQVILLDYSPPRCHLLIVMGHLIFDNVDINFDCTYVMVNYGHLTIGTPEAPYTKNCVITLHGDRLTPEIPVHGSKVIAMRHGVIDMHGMPRRTWTLLAQNALVGAGRIAVRGPVDWNVGEMIAIAPTGYDFLEAEDREIVGVNPPDGQADVVDIYIERPLKYYHHGERQCFGANNEYCIDEIAEVALLSRNIRIQGDRNSRRLGFGATMDLMPMDDEANAYARISFVEFADCGQQYMQGRHPLSFFYPNSASRSFVKGTSVHHSLNRAFSLRGVTHVTYENNVVYDTKGHAFFLADGSERHNVIKDNLVMLTRVSTSGLNTDVKPANFWITSPLNYLINNHAAGSRSSGFWFAPSHPYATGLTGSHSICPSTQRLGAFDSNVAHSNGEHGLNIFRYWWPKEQECNRNSADAQAIMHNTFVYKNQIHGVTLGHSEAGQIGSVIFNGLVAADNGMNHHNAAGYWVEKIAAANMTVGVQNSLFVALSNNMPYSRTAKRRAINLPCGDNFFSENVTFVNYVNENYGYEPQAYASRHSLHYPYGWEAVSRGLKWVNSPNRALFRFVHHGILDDDDGTLTGTPRSQLVPQAPMFDELQCNPVEGFNTLIPALVCPESYKIRRFGISTNNQLYTNQKWTVGPTLDGGNKTEIVPSIGRSYLVTAPINKWVIIDWQHWFNPSRWDWQFGGPRFMLGSERQLFFTTYAETRHHVYGYFDGALNKNWQEPPPDLDDVASDYSFDNETMLYTGLLHRPHTKMVVYAKNCADTGCPTPPPTPAPPPITYKPCEPYSEDDSWSSGSAPQDGADVIIQSADSLCLIPQAENCEAGQQFIYNFASLQIQGSLFFRNEDCPCPGAEIVINVDSYIWIRQGGFSIGNETHPIEDCSVTIKFGLIPFGDSLLLMKHFLPPFGFRAINLESGILQMHAAVRGPRWTQLSAKALAGSTTLTLKDSVSWTAGDVIAIAGTSRGKMNTVNLGTAGQSERARIESVSDDGKVVTLQEPLQYDHDGGEAQTINGHPFFTGAEVGLLTRLITIRGVEAEDTVPAYLAGWRLNVGCTGRNYEGCGEFDGFSWPMSESKTGVLQINGVLLQNVGQGGTPHGGVELDGLIGPGGDASASYFSNNAIWGAYGNAAIAIRDSTTKFSVSNNVLFDARGDGVRAASAGNTILSNLAMQNNKAEPGCRASPWHFWDCRQAHFRVHGGNEVRGNVAASGANAGFMTDGGDCATGLLWSDNVAHSVREGLFVADVPAESYNLWWPSPSLESKCRVIGGLTAYSCSDHGLIAWYAKGDVHVKDFTSVDNQVGVFVLSLTEAVKPPRVPKVVYSDLTLAGAWDGQTCRDGYTQSCRSTLLNSKHWCEFFWTAQPTFGSIGMLETLFATNAHGVGRTSGETSYMWEEMDSYSTMEGQAEITNVHFANWNGDDACKQKNVAFFQSLYSNDTFHHHVFSGISWSNIENGGKFYARNTYGEIPEHPTDENTPTWWLDFDNWAYGASWPDAPNKVWLADKDGSFTETGVMSSVLSSETITRPTQFDKLRWNGRGFAPDLLPPPRAGCTYHPEWNAHYCDSSYKWMTVALESFAGDALTRRAGPVVLCKGNGMVDVNGDPLCQGGVVDYSSGPVSKGRIHRATLERMSRWRFIAENSGNYTLSFRGDVPSWLQLSLQNWEYTGLASENVGVTLNLRYSGENSACRVGVYVDRKRQRPVFGFGYPWEMDPPMTWPGPTDAAGTHFHDRYVDSEKQTSTGSFGYQRNVLYLTVRPGQKIKIKLEPIIQINMELAMPITDFFNNKAVFVAAMCSVLGIPESRLRIARIVPGTTRRREGSSTLVFVEIEQDEAISEAEAAAEPEAPVTIPNDFPSVVNKIPTLLTNLTFTVVNVTSKVIQVVEPRPQIKVVAGNPYISLNMTMPTEAFKTTEIRQMITTWILGNLDMAPFNTTTLENVHLSGTYTDNATKFTQCAILLSYPSMNDTKDGIIALYDQLVEDSSEVFLGWTIRDLLFDLNGWVADPPSVEEDIFTTSATTTTTGSGTTTTTVAGQTTTTTVAGQTTTTTQGSSATTGSGTTTTTVAGQTTTTTAGSSATTGSGTTTTTVAGQTTTTTVAGQTTTTTAGSSATTGSGTTTTTVAGQTTTTTAGSSATTGSGTTTTTVAGQTTTTTNEATTSSSPDLSANLQPKRQSSSKSNVMIIGVSVVGFIVFVMVAIGLCFMCRKTVQPESPKAATPPRSDHSPLNTSGRRYSFEAFTPEGHEAPTKDTEVSIEEEVSIEDVDLIVEEVQEI